MVGFWKQVVIAFCRHLIEASLRLTRKNKTENDGLQSRLGRGGEEKILFLCKQM
jgi:hypothetical protein